MLWMNPNTEVHRMECVWGGTIVFEERTSKAMIWSDLLASGDFILEVELLQPA